MWINQGDIILLSLRDFQDNKADVLYKYTPDEARALKAQKEIPEGAKINEFDAGGPGGAGADDGEDLVQFENEDIDDVSKVLVMSPPPSIYNPVPFLARFKQAAAHSLISYINFLLMRVCRLNVALPPLPLSFKRRSLIRIPKNISNIYLKNSNTMGWVGGWCGEEYDNKKAHEPYGEQGRD